MRRWLLAAALVLMTVVFSVARPGPAGGGEPEPSSTTTVPSAASQSPDETTTTTTRPPGAGSVRGTLVDRQESVDTDDDEPIEGARISVAAIDGTPLGETKTDDEGKFEILLPGEGTYRATLDEDTLPSGVSIADGAETLEFFISPGQDRILLFPLNAAERITEGTLDLFLQALADGIYFGLVIAMASVGLSLIYGTTGLVNFAHGELVTLGALFAYWFNRSADLPLLLAAPLAIVLAGGVGWLLDAGFWGPLRRRGTGNTALMVISIGLALAVLNFYLYVFGGLTRPYSDYRAQPGWEFGTIVMPPKKLVAGAVCLVVLVGVATALQRTRMGKAMRAIADNPDLAASSGINVDQVIRLVWMFGAALAALGGVVFSISQDVNVDQGNAMLLLLFAAITLGGLGAAYGALAGGFLIGLLVSLSAVWIPTELKNVGALVVLILVLLVRPQGILGRRERIG